MHKHIGNIRSNIDSILSGNYTHSQLNEIISLSHSFAIILLKKKRASGKLNLTLINLDLHDLAFDCIAELFRTDDDYSLIQLKVYFGSLQLGQFSDVQLVDHLRRIVFSKVNQGIFRIYQEYDGSLGKIIRNIKIAIQSLGNFVEVERFGETFIVPSLIDPQFHLPIMPKDVLEKYLREIVTGNERIPEVMAKLSLFLREQTLYAKVVSLIGFAIALRMVFSEETFNHEEVSYQRENGEDIEGLIRTISLKVMKKHKAKYVLNQKISNTEYEKIFNVIRKNLSTIAIEHDGQVFSLYEHLSREIIGLKKAEYKERYRAIVEYLLLLTKKELGKELKRQL